MMSHLNEDVFALAIILAVEVDGSVGGSTRTAEVSLR